MFILHDLRAQAMAAFFLLLCCFDAHAQDASLTDPRWIVVASPALTYHYSQNPEHRSVKVLGLERHAGASSQFWGGDRSLWGATYFTNSFGQPSGYAYYGGVTDSLLGSRNWYFNWTAGVLYGYRPPYQDKVPFNHNGWSPGLVFGVGYKVTPAFGLQLNALGNSALMITLNYRIK